MVSKNWSEKVIFTRTGGLLLGCLGRANDQILVDLLVQGGKNEGLEGYDG